MKNKLYFAGIDIGSTMTKVAIIDRTGEIVSVVKGPTGPEHRRLAHEVMKVALDQSRINLEDIVYIVATGYGRVNVPFADRQITELTCHARGVSSLFSNVRTAIDIGGQDAKCMKIRKGKLIDFVMNDKCAAGTGRFLEMISETLGINLDEMGAMARKATKKVRMSNLCTIFVQQEIVAGLSAGETVENIIAGVNEALVSRIASMARRLRIESDVVLTGGVAKNAGIIEAMRENLGCNILVPADPLMTGALGAALLASEIAAQEHESKFLQEKPRTLKETTFFE